MRKDSPNLYEILKNATGGARTPPEVQPRTASVIVEAAPPPETPGPAPVKPPSVPRVTVPSRPPETPAPPKAIAGPGERVIRVTYNTAIFGGLILLGALCLSFAIGQRVGKSKGRTEAAAVAADPAAEPTLGADPAPTGGTKSWAIKLMEWPANNARERTGSEAAAAGFINSLKQTRRFHPVWDRMETRGDKTFRVLYCGQFKNRTEGREMLAEVKKHEYQKKKYFAGADLEELE